MISLSVLDPEKIEFPETKFALEDGLLAVGGDLNPVRLLLAYSLGIFPWYNEEDPILWYSPSPRMVLFPEELYVSKTMRQLLRRTSWKVTFNQAFEKVIRSCGTSGHRSEGTWIHEDLIEAYLYLNEKNYCHSVEVWDDNKLIGGLYGIAFGKVFYGESMFAEVPNASKFGLIKLVERLRQLDIQVIDCQQETEHLKSLGAKCIGREQFEGILKQNMDENGFKVLSLVNDL